MDEVERTEDKYLPLRSNPHQLFQITIAKESRGREEGTVWLGTSDVTTYFYNSELEQREQVSLLTNTTHNRIRESNSHPHNC